MERADGLGWCVELLPSSTTNRFATLDDAQQFVTANAGYIKEEEYDDGPWDEPTFSGIGYDI
jgi:hypothetical protein